MKQLFAKLIQSSTLIFLVVLMSFQILHAQNLKRGLGMSTNTTTGTWYGNVTNTNSSWFYTWGVTIPDNQLVNMPDAEFVPMFWGAGSVTTTNINKLIDLKNQGKIKYILGFNEPDLSVEANMTVEQALSLWPQLESIGLPLVSPVTSFPILSDGSWFRRFMDTAIAQGRRIDYIAVHMYMNDNPDTYINVLQNVWDRYQIPIWITEFAVRDENTGGIPANNRYTPEMILTFMNNLLPRLEALPFIYRYAWFNPSPTMAGLWPCALINQDGSLTSLGNYYKTVGPVANLALGKTTSASTTQTGNTAANAVDGNITSTRWAASSATMPQWWKVDLGSSQNIENCDIYWYNGSSRSYQYIIETSTDNVNFTTRVNKSTNTTMFTKSTDAVNTTARYVRVTISGCSASGAYASMYDVQLFGGSANTPPTVSITAPANNATYNAPASVTINASAADADGTVSKVEFFNGSNLLGTDTSSPYSYSWTNVVAGTYSITAKATDNKGAVTTSSPINITVNNVVISNLALNKTASASTDQGRNPAASAVDGNTTSTRWSASSTAMPQWWKVDLGAACDLSSVDIYWFSGANRSYKYIIETSTDNVNFTTRVNKSTNTTFYVKSTDPVNVTARYVRVTISGCSNSGGYASMYEVHVFGSLKSAFITDYENAIPVSKQLFSMFPNPAQNGSTKLQISNNDANSFSTIEVADLNGRLILKESFIDNTFILNNLKRGIYFVRVSSNTETTIKKLIVD